MADGINRININGFSFHLRDSNVMREPIWSANTGRGSDGKMLGDIVDWKYKLEITFPPMNDEEAVRYGEATLAAFYNVTFHDPFTNREITRVMYNGSQALKPYSSRDIFNDIRYQDVTIHLIEQ